MRRYRASELDSRWRTREQPIRAQGRGLLTASPRENMIAEFDVMRSEELAPFRLKDYSTTDKSVTSRELVVNE